MRVAAHNSWSVLYGSGAMQVGRYFQLKERGSTLTTELRAGTVTFLTVGEVHIGILRAWLRSPASQTSGKQASSAMSCGARSGCQYWRTLSMQGDADGQSPPHMELGHASNPMAARAFASELRQIIHACSTPELDTGICKFTFCPCMQIAYILAVNASIVADTGGPCGPADCTVSRVSIPLTSETQNLFTAAGLSQAAAIKPRHYMLSHHWHTHQVCRASP